MTTAASAWAGAKCEATAKGRPSAPATRAPLTEDPRIQARGPVPSPGTARTRRKGPVVAGTSSTRREAAAARRRACSSPAARDVGTAASAPAGMSEPGTPAVASRGIPPR